jgi:hypothetical protein
MSCLCPAVIPYLRMYKPYYFDKNLSPKIGVRLTHGISFSEKVDLSGKKAFILLTTEPATQVLYVVKLPVETASV